MLLISIRIRTKLRVKTILLFAHLLTIFAIFFVFVISYFYLREVQSV